MPSDSSGCFPLGGEGLYPRRVSVRTPKQVPVSKCPRCYLGEVEFPVFSGACPRGLVPMSAGLFRLGFTLVQARRLETSEVANRLR